MTNCTLKKTSLLKAESRHFPQYVLFACRIKCWSCDMLHHEEVKAVESRKPERSFFSEYIVNNVQSETELPFTKVPLNRNTKNLWFSYYHHVFLSSPSSANKRLLPLVIFSTSSSRTTSYHSLLQHILKKRLSGFRLPTAVPSSRFSFSRIQ